MSTKMINAKQTGHFSVKPQAPKPSFFEALASTVLTWQERSEMRRNLSELDSRSLEDMGLTSAMVQDECRKPFWQA
ncbi:DUF1127 domain-containing protein [Sneathiella limimaris]|uniref:DUF1127 domain-containing protein n=1 Tax=Sneathiella limimaris TaxID=1964213 RepID=UPI00146E0DBF|nr:DUF1127 domain-containing protein [Sneathiella limimaris]